MYLPAAFAITELSLLHGLMRANPLATLITLNPEGLAADHIPVQVCAGPAPHGLLRGHVARANPLWREHPADLEALAVFQGPQAYVSPSFYATKRLTGEVVPTWNYAVVHAYGRLRFIHDPEWLLQLVAELTDAHEAARPLPWTVGDAPPPYVAKMLNAIVGFELPITRIAGKWKVSQNRSAADLQGVIEGLRSAADGGSQAVAELAADRAAK